MIRALVVTIAATASLLQGCPSAYQRTYERETQRLEQQAAAEHAAASRYAAVVYFDVGSSTVDAAGRRELAWFVQQMQPYPQAVILVQGFADTTGSEATNQGLSDARARAVAADLTANGIASSRLEVQGYGTASAADSNATAKGRSRNRRVEVTVR
jgi:outer membrane protein OmpA-like peptidoglycan-associated protein